MQVVMDKQRWGRRMVAVRTTRGKPIHSWATRADWRTGSSAVHTAVAPCRGLSVQTSDGGTEGRGMVVEVVVMERGGRKGRSRTRQRQPSSARCLAWERGTFRSTFVARRGGASQPCSTFAAAMPYREAEWIPLWALLPQPSRDRGHRGSLFTVQFLLLFLLDARWQSSIIHALLRPGIIINDIDASTIPPHDTISTIDTRLARGTLLGNVAKCYFCASRQLFLYTRYNPRWSKSCACCLDVLATL